MTHNFFNRLTMMIVAVYFAVVGLFLLALCVALCEQAVGDIPPSSDNPPRRHLPTVCSPFYEQPGDEWIECMGVGRK